jgi:hypothetical protein
MPIQITTTQATKQSTIFALFTSPSKYCNMQNDLSITTNIVPNQWKLLFIDRHISNSVDAVLYQPQHYQSQSISWLTTTTLPMSVEVVVYPPPLTNMHLPIRLVE